MNRRILFSVLLSVVSVSNIFAQTYQPDLNKDGFVNFADFAMFAENWQKSGIGLIGDLDGSGTVDEADLMRLSYYWLSEFEWKNPDFNHDGIVNFLDFAVFADAWLSSNHNSNWDPDCDFNDDDLVNIIDLNRFARQWLRNFPKNVIYADAGAAAGGDGTSWDKAFIYLQDAIKAASKGCQIWAAQGVYRPDANSNFPNGTHLRASTFKLPQGVAIYGGFPAGGRWEHRNPDLCPTTLSGDIGIAGNRNDNCYNVVVGANDVTLDGLIIADGNATSTGDKARGGGMRNEDVNNITIANCIFSNNHARYDGGAIYNYKSSISFINCIFSENKSGDDGAGVYNSNTDANLTDCSFFDNRSGNRGGGIYNYQSGSELINCLFNNNHADANGGAVYNGYKAVKLINCTIAGNSAGKNTGGIYNMYSSSVITNCIVWNNNVEIYNHSSSPHILYSDVKGCGASGAGWNANFGEDDGNNIDSDPCFADATQGRPCFTDELALEAASPCINAGKNSALPLDIKTDIDGNARFNGIVDMGAYEYGQLDMTQDLDGDGLFDWWEYRYGLNPNDANDAQGDIDSDGLSNLAEYNGGCDPIFFDTDGDLLSDGWEVLYGLNPLVSDVVEVVDGNNVYADNDGDGLDALKEIVYGTSPTAADSDGDGASDGVEVAQGSLPMDATDLGLPPSADQVCTLRLTVGDWSNSNSERYDLVVGPVTHQATQFGVVATANYSQFRPGNRYEVRIVHRGTDPAKWFYPNADYDYVVQIEAVSLPAGVVMQIEDADGILGYHGEPNTPNHIFDAAGKVAYVNLNRVKITEPDGNPVTDNHFVFNSSGSGVCNVIATGTTGTSGKDSDLEWLLTAISGSTQTSTPNPAKGPNITFTYTGLPTSNSQFGVKTLTLTYPPTSQQDTKQVEIFFNKIATNHPGMGSGVTPNWYYYWTYAGVSTGTHQYNASLGADGQYAFGNNYFEIGPSACGQDYGLVVKGDGIDNFGSTCLHEKAHMDYYFSVWNPYDHNQDLDGDLLKDSQETSLIGLNGQPYDPNKYDTDEDDYYDGEDWACKYENIWGIGSCDNADWSSPGHQSNK